MKAKKLRRAMRVNLRKEVSEETINLLTKQVQMIHKLNTRMKWWRAFALAQFPLYVAAAALWWAGK